MKELIRKIAPPGYDKKNRRKLYDVIGRLGDVTASDAVKVLRDFFPYLADSKALKKHASALSIPRYETDTEEAFRLRVATAAFYIFKKGTRDFFRGAMEQRFPGRDYELIEDFMRLNVSLVDMSDEDIAWIREFFEAELDPNILLGFIYEFLWAEGFSPEDNLEYAIEESDATAEAWEWGFCYDGEALHDHGYAKTYEGRESHGGDTDYSLDVASRYVGSLRYDGAKDHRITYPVLGTWTGFRYTLWLMSGAYNYGGAMNYNGIPTPVDKPTQAATYSSNEDELELTIERIGGSISKEVL